MRALLSVHDKTGIADFAKGLVELGHEIVSTGGTLAHLRSHGVPALSISDVTGFPEILDGRVKTLHPRIHAALLARSDLPEHRAALTVHEITPIQVVACNLYPFEATVSRPDVPLETAIEQIDIGGPAMIRAAAKNFADVVVVTSPTRYESILQSLSDGEVSQAERRKLAAAAFAHVSAYDAVVAEYLRTPDRFPDDLTIAARKATDLRYGENPQQRAAAYRRVQAGGSRHGVLDGVQLAGKALSYNNVLDADAAWRALRSMPRPAVSIVKHSIPCGLAMRSSLSSAFDEALAGDPVSAFGGIVGLNRTVDIDVAERIASIFFEVVIAPGFTPASVELLGKRRQLRLLEMGNAAEEEHPIPPTLDLRPIVGGWLVQEPDTSQDDESAWRVASRRIPTEIERGDLRFAWHAARIVKSNAIVLAIEDALVGVGSGQPNRLESVRIAIDKAGDRARGAVLASDAFFPFADGLEEAIRAGIAAVIQPGGSIRDGEVVAAADAADVAMIFTGRRHFLH